MKRKLLVVLLTFAMIGVMCIVPVSAETANAENARMRGAIPEYYDGETWERIAGDNRYETAFKIADELRFLRCNRGFSNYVIATGENYPDALTGSYLASCKDAPILLVNSVYEQRVVDYMVENMDTSTDEIKRVWILGGTGVVSQRFENMLRNRGFAVERCAGDNRYVTNAYIIDETKYEGNPNMIVCTGDNYADALSASAANAPIMLVDSNQKEFTLVQSVLANTMINYGARVCYIAGGPNVVSYEVEAILQSKGLETVRIAGSDRYETSIDMGAYFSPYYLEEFIYVTGENYPDGISAGPLAVKKNVPIYLTSPDGGWYYYAGATPTVTVVGGEGILPKYCISANIKDWATNSPYRK